MDERYLLLETRPVKVLLVEDDEIDQMAVKRAFKRAGIENEMIIANDGVEALEVLRGDGDEDFGAPYIILLDLNMPRMGGLEFLQELRQDPLLNRSIVFVLTTSDDETDIAAAYDATLQIERKEERMRPHLHAGRSLAEAASAASSSAAE